MYGGRRSPPWISLKTNANGKAPFTRYNLLSSRLSNRFDNRLNTRLVHTRRGLDSGVLHAKAVSTHTHTHTYILPTKRLIIKWCDVLVLLSGWSNVEFRRRCLTTISTSSERDRTAAGFCVSRSTTDAVHPTRARAPNRHKQEMTSQQLTSECPRPTCFRVGLVGDAIRMR